MSSDTVAQKSPRRRRARRKLNTPLNLALAAALIGLVAFWLGGRMQDEGSSAPAALAMPVPEMGASASGPRASAGSAAQGEVTSVDGNTLYVSSGDGVTVEVRARRNATVARNANVKPAAIHPGDEVTVDGKANKAGVVLADSIIATQSGLETAMPSFGGGMPEGIPGTPDS